MLDLAEFDQTLGVVSAGLIRPNGLDQARIDPSGVSKTERTLFTRYHTIHNVIQK